MKVKRTEKAERVKIRTEYIKLQDFLKFCGDVPTGGAAKLAVEAGAVQVNGEVCTMRGKKLRAGDTVTYGGKRREVCNEAE